MALAGLEEGIGARGDAVLDPPGIGDEPPPRRSVGEPAEGLEDGTAAVGLPPAAAEADLTALALGRLDSAALMISSSNTFNAAQRTIHSTMSSLPSPSVCQTAFSSTDLPVIVTLVPPPPPDPCVAFF